MIIVPFYRPPQEKASPCAGTTTVTTRSRSMPARSRWGR